MISRVGTKRITISSSRLFADRSDRRTESQPPVEPRQEHDNASPARACFDGVARQCASKVDTSRRTGHPPNRLAGRTNVAGPQRGGAADPEHVLIDEPLALLRLLDQRLLGADQIDEFVMMGL